MASVSSVEISGSQELTTRLGDDATADRRCGVHGAAALVRTQRGPASRPRLLRRGSLRLPQAALEDWWALQDSNL